MSQLALTGLVNLITCFCLGLFVLLKNPRRNMNRGFFFGCCTISLYSFSYLMWQTSSNADEALLWMRVLVTGYMLMTAGFLHFVLSLVEIIDQKRKEIIIYYILNFIFIIINWTPLFYPSLTLKPGFGYWPVITPGLVVYLVFWMWQGLYGVSCLYRGLRLSRGIRREQIRFFTIGSMISILGGSTNLLYYFEINVPPYGNIALSVFVVLVAYSIIKHGFLDIKVAFTRAGIFLFIYTIVLGLPITVGFYTNFGLASFIILFILATAGPLLYRYFQMKAENVLHARQKKYQKFLNEAARGIVREQNLDRLTKLIVYMVARAVRLNFAVIFLEDRATGNYRLEAWRGKIPFPQDIIINAGDPLIALMKRKERPFLNEDNRYNHVNSILPPVKVMVPCLIDDRLSAFLLLSGKRDNSLYAPDDISAFDLLSKETALAIENCFSIQERDKVQERLFKTEKLSIIGGMAEGIAHQIKNRLNYFSLAASGIQLEVDGFFRKYETLAEQFPDLKETFEELNTIGNTLMDNVKKTDDVIHKIIAYARVEKKENMLAEFSLKDVLDVAASLAQVKHDFKNSPVHVSISGSDIIYGIKSEIMESIYSILDNSYEAIEEKMKYRLKLEERKEFAPSIKISLTRKAGSSLIKISDNGVGIKEEDRDKIFAPYFTTKSSYKTKSNAGVGMYIMYKVIDENHSGKIWFESEYMKGTDIFIELPDKGIKD